jgi:hypothetical protein
MEHETHNQNKNLSISKLVHSLPDSFVLASIEDMQEFQRDDRKKEKMKFITKIILSRLCSILHGEDNERINQIKTASVGQKMISSYISNNKNLLDDLENLANKVSDKLCLEIIHNYVIGIEEKIEDGVEKMFGIPHFSSIRIGLDEDDREENKDHFFESKIW